ncbi:MAG TPA: hypothetical protein VF595_12775 [Tepidisphaeraceae bacterium]|jgi:hypothetical protein
MPHDAFSPLHLADAALLRPSAWERRWMFLPVAGWFVSGMLYCDRVQLARIDVRRQLASRSHFPSEAWDAIDLSSERAEVVCRLIALCFVLPNHFFLPNDPNSLLFLDQDGIGPIDITMKIKDRLGVELLGRPNLFKGVLADFVSQIYPALVAA